MRNKIQIILLTIAAFLFFISCDKETKEMIADSGPQQYGIAFSNIPETQRIVMYEVNIRAFSANGNLQDVISRLDSIKNLGINVIWLMPVYPVGEINSVNSPYCIKNYMKVNAEFGSLDDLRELTDEAHIRNMAVVLDWVANHTAWDNPWIDNTDWYSQVDGEIISPPGTGWNDVADLNFDNMEMRKEMIASMQYWVLEANIDGFRCDAADYVPYDFWKQAIDSLKCIKNRKLILLAEGSRTDHFDAGFQMNYGWSFYGKLKDVFVNGTSASGIYTTHLSEYIGLPAGAERLRFTTNHDESAWDATPIEIFNGADGAMAASIIAVCLGGIPLIYGSQEVGTSGTVAFFYNDPINWNTHPEMLQFYNALMQFYNSSDPLVIGGITNYTFTDAVCFKKKIGEEEVVVIVNVRNANTEITLPADLQYTNWKDAFTNEDLTLTETLSLNNYGFKILYH
ncbi:MAG: alpha-amylase [Bacteroidetes bacterium]|nr:alpha-amylase [Bacteroidota bacterium]